jgi:hypothetical protein
MSQALEDEVEDTYRALEVQHNVINRHMFSILRQLVSRSQPINHPVPLSVPNERTWQYDGSSYVIYFNFREVLIPWLVWMHMPVSMLSKAAINLVASKGLQVHPDEIILYIP